MATQITQKSARLNIRLRTEIKDRIEKAANILGTSVSDFAVSALGKTADEVLEHFNSIELTNRDRDIFLSVLDKRSKAKPNKILIRAAKTHKKLIAK